MAAKTSKENKTNSVEKATRVIIKSQTDNDGVADTSEHCMTRLYVYKLRAEEKST